MKKENILFFIIFLLIIFGGGIKPYLLSKKINWLENRTAEQIPEFSIVNFINGTYQDNYENALADQIPLSLRMKSIEKDISLELKLLYYKINNNFYNNLGNNIYLAKDYLIHNYYSLDEKLDLMDNRIANINSVIKNLKNNQIYVYYIESDEDINFQSNKHTGLYKNIKNNIDKKAIIDNFEISNFDDYRKNFYKTDHHWDYKGSYKGYLDLLQLFNLNSPLKPLGKACISTRYSGSKATMLGSSHLDENFCFYKFNIPHCIIKENDKIVESYGKKEIFYNDKVINEQYLYGEFYGGDLAIVEFDFNNSDKHNLLILGNSFDNAISDLLASHFNKTYLIDLRHYKDEFNNEFNISNFVEDNEIDDILFIGNADYFINSEFNVKGDF